VNYYVRSYAINNFGISYGVEIPFTTLFGLATLTTNNVIAQSVTASSGGNITDNGGSTVTARGVVWNTTGTPSISNSKTTDGSGTGSYVSNISTLSPSTTYFVRAYATNSAGTAYGNEQTFTTAATSQTVTDIDGNTYNNVQIGTQVWMCENLKTSRYRNGGSIPYVVGNADWQALTTGAWSYYDHDVANNAIYGKLYNWFTTKGDTLCPTDWHVPTDAEWTVLTDYLGGVSVAGGKMKTVGTAYWNSPNTDATNESGFSALPGSYRNNDGSFNDIMNIALFWSASGAYGNGAWSRGLYSSNGFVFKGSFPYFDSYLNKSSGASVRCLKNNVPNISTNIIGSISSSTTTSGGIISSDGGATVIKRGVVWSIFPNPTINLSTKTTDGTGTGYFVSNISGLSPSTTYYIRAYATNNVGTAYGNELTFTTSEVLIMNIPCPGTPTINDIDGNSYNTVQIGSQCWTKENLKVSRYNNGDIIPIETDNTVWSGLATGARCWYVNDSSTYQQPYGKLYNWYAASDSRGICPFGWHVPTDDEWTTLTSYLGGESVAGGKMKSIGTAYWNGPNTRITNESGFSALPGGYRSFAGMFLSNRNAAFFWSATEIASNIAWNRTLADGDSNSVGRFNDNVANLHLYKSVGASIRCIKDL
jgi:uncharacterized protein (TIGR02145 family)